MVDSNREQSDEMKTRNDNGNDIRIRNVIQSADTNNLLVAKTCMHVWCQFERKFTWIFALITSHCHDNAKLVYAIIQVFGEQQQQQHQKKI